MFPEMTYDETTKYRKGVDDHPPKQLAYGPDNVLCEALAASLNQPNPGSLLFIDHQVCNFFLKFFFSLLDFVTPFSNPCTPLHTSNHIYA